MQHCLMLDLQDDLARIEAYEAHHRAVWPEVEAHLRRHGVLRLELFRLGTRLCMVMETDDARFDAARMAAAAASEAPLVDWEELMSQFQTPTPWTPPGVKWVEAASIYRFTA
jgi:L-rhamnose mutarotase